MTNNYSCYEGRLDDVSITSDFWSIPELNRHSALSTAVFTLAFMTVGLPSNLLIIAGILWQRLYKEPPHILLLNLAIADLLVCVLVMPFTVISGFAGRFVVGDSDSTKCKWCATGVVFVALCLLSLHTLALLSVDRFIFVKFSMRYHQIVTARKVVCCVLLVWVFCIAISLCPFGGFGDVYFSFSISTCTIRFETVTKNVHYFIFLLVVAFLPLSVLVATNAWVACIVQKQIRKIYYTARKSLPKEQVTMNIRKRLNKEQNLKQLQLMRVFGAILLSNIVTWLPMIIRILITAIKGDDDFPLWFYVLVYLSISFAAVLHPLIQASLIPEIRNSCKTVISRALCWCKVFEACDSCDRKSLKRKSDIASTRASTGICFCFDVLDATVLPSEELGAPA